jgi:class 3 adenylate cyclase/tetratricopeptide (TPR) repeat protein
MVDPEMRRATRWRHNVRKHPLFRIAGAYCVFAWILMQAGEIILPSFEAPAWVMQVLIGALVAGLPLVILLARMTRLPNVFGLGDTGPHTSSPAPATPPPAAPPPAAPPPAAAGNSPGAEREAEDILRLKDASLTVPMDLSESRQVTALVCSLIGLRGEQEDPELLLGFLAGLKEQLAAAVERYEGTRLPSSRSEIVVAFGFPQAHEDDGRRAAKLALDLLELIRCHDVTDGPDTRVIVRAGLHTATIIIDESAEESDELSLLGDTVGVASYLQAAAPEGGVVLSETSAALLRAFFMLDDLGRQSHPRLGRDAILYRLGQELTDQLAMVIAEQSEVIGREHEQSLLRQQWQTVLEGEAEYVLIKGEPGMGKTALLYHMVKDLVASGSAQLVLLTCEPYYRDVPFRPVIHFLERTVLRGERPEGEEREARLREFIRQVLREGDDEVLSLLEGLLSTAPGDERFSRGASGKQVRERTLAMLVQLMELFARRQPLVVAVEDMQWADPSTRDLIETLLATDPDSPILGVFTARPEFTPAWSNLPDVMELNLNKLSSRAARELIRHRAGEGALAPELEQQIIDSAAGIPLYIDQLTRTVLESRADGGGGSIAIPPSLKASLAARVDNLGSAKPLLQLCSVIGLEFSYELLRAVCDSSDEKLLRQVLNTIVNAGLIYQKGALPRATFKFKHRLIMEVASQSLLRRTRQELHAVIADRLEAQFPERCERRPTQVAHHFSLAGKAARAIPYWIRAARMSQATFANEEALAQVQHAMAALPEVSDREQRQQFEITLQALLGTILLAHRGYSSPEVRVAFERALELSGKVEQTPALFRMIVGLWMYYLICGEYRRARELSDQLLQIAGHIDEAPELMQANYCAGYVCYYCGEIRPALDYFEESLVQAGRDGDFTRQTPSGDDSRTHLYCLHAVALWTSGSPQAAEQSLDRAEALAREIGEPYGIVWVLNWMNWLEHMRGNADRVRRYADEMLEISRARCFSFFIPLAMFFQASVSEDSDKRLLRLQRSHDMVKSAGGRAGIGYMDEILIRELIARGDLQAARALAAETAVSIAERGEWLFASENQRLQALLARDLDGDLEACCQQLEAAVAQARAIGNQPFALACALTLYEQEGGPDRALPLLTGILAAYASEDDCENYRRAAAILAPNAPAGLSA